MGLTNFILTCEKDNEELRKDINYYKNMTSRLKKEKQELKKQLEKINKFKFSCKKDETQIPTTIYNKKTIEDISKIKSQQKEFIKWLEDEIKLYENDILNFSKDYNVYFSLINDLRVSKAKIGDILKKYKEIIGVSDENRTKI